MTHLVTMLLVGASISIESPGQAAAPTGVPVVMRCLDGGVVQIAEDRVHVTCRPNDLLIAGSAIRNITLSPPIPAFAIPLTVMGGIPLGRRDSVILSVQGPDDQEHSLILHVNHDDLTAGLSALSRLTHLPVFTQRLDDDLTAAGVPQTLATYTPPQPSETQRAKLENLSPASAAVTEAGDVVIVYASGRATVWNPATMEERPFDGGAIGTTGGRCYPYSHVVGIRHRTAAIYSCGRVIVYDLNSGDRLTEVSVQHPGGAALNPADGALYWFQAGQLHRRGLTPDAVDSAPVPFAERFERLAFSPSGDLLFCSRLWRGKYAHDPAQVAATDLYVYKFDQGKPSLVLRVEALKGVGPDEIGIHPGGTRLATLSQERWSAREIVTLWDVHTVAKRVKRVKRVRLPKASFVIGGSLRYSADGAALVVKGRSLDTATAKIRCSLSVPLIDTTRPNTRGLSAGIGYGGAAIGVLPKVVVWDTATCEIHSTFDPAAERQSAET